MEFHLHSGLDAPTGLADPPAREWSLGERQVRRRQLVSSDEAVTATRQHTQPCGDCPWARASLPGWLGPATAQEWLAAAHADGRIDCHTLIGAQCAGSAIYRRNVCKLDRDPAVLRLEADRARVFRSPAEFLAHHGDEP